MKVTGAILLSLVAYALPASLHAQPTLTFGPDAVTAKGLTPGGTAVWFGAARGRGEWLDHTYRFQQVASDDDGDGAVTFKRPQGIPDQSVNVVVDLASGELAWGGPPGVPHEGPRAFPVERASYGPSGAIERLDEQTSRLAVLVCRRGEGVWTGDIFDGAPRDGDGASNARVIVDFTTLSPLGATPAHMGGVQPGDAVVLIDGDTLRFTATRLPARAS